MRILPAAHEAWQMSGEQDGVTKSDSGIDELDDFIEVRLAAQVVELEGRLRTVSAAYKQKSDEIEATKTRLERNSALREEIRRGEVVAALFEPVENLHRSIHPLHALAPDAAAGLMMVHQQFITALKALGLEEVGREGERFDPSMHEAIHSEPVADLESDNTVLRVFSTGFRNGRQLIRPARVVIGVYTEAGGEA